jgi:PAS domain S-box-containing protein
VTAEVERNPRRWHELASALDALSQPMAIIADSQDGGGVILYINSAWTGLTGYTAAEAIGRPAAKVMFGPETNMAEVSRIRQSVQAGGAGSADINQYHKNGGVVPVRFTLTGLRFPGERDEYLIGASVRQTESAGTGQPENGQTGCKILAFGHSDDDRSRAVRQKQRLASDMIAAQLQFEESIFACPFGVQRTDLSGRILYANPIFHALLGFDDNELNGEVVYDRLQDAENAHAFKIYMKHVLTKQPKPTPAFTTYRRKNGNAIDLRLDWAFDRNARGDLAGLISVVTPLHEDAWPETEAAAVSPSAPAAGIVETAQEDAEDQTKWNFMERRTVYRIVHAARVWTSVLSDRHRAGDDGEILGKIDHSLEAALRTLGKDRPPHVEASDCQDEIRPLIGLTVAVVEPIAALRESLADLLRSWGCHTIPVDRAENAVARVLESGRLPDILVADLAAGIGMGGESAIRLLRGKYASGLPVVLLGDGSAPETEMLATSTGMRVLRRPIHPIELRGALLGLWHSSRKS